MRTCFPRHRRAALAALASLLLPAAWIADAAAQEQPLKILVGYPAGGSADAAARALAEPLRVALGRQIVIDNRPGAGGMIAAQVMKALPADDSTVLLVNDHMVSMIPFTMKTPGYDPVKDFAALGQVAKFNLALGVSAGSGMRTMPDYIRSAKGSASMTSYGIPAPGSSMQFVGYVLGKSAGVDLVPVPYKGAAPLVSDMLGNQIAVGIVPVTDFAEHHKAGKLRVIAVTGKARSALLPDVPTFTELGYKGLDKDNFVGFYAPAKSSPKFIATFAEALRTVLESADVRERFIKLGFEPAYATPRAFSEQVAADGVYWGEVVRQSGFQPQ
jgi:tripartite-type tricarboxylate transporter receptor subunit TctC